MRIRMSFCWFFPRRGGTIC